ncbi:ABC transporter permease [Phaeobacter gallaeciensis]|uniref:ABC transporter permease n=1 Tax=Phaeobacter gallaeciensis TaxID=60890 RepID=UPI00237F6A4E|nr:ABC transporter permease [Phaeobacter gallaeciensis]MDE4191536.1 ABC transporter permease [Phaeobacter gallaeciensis]MDE4199999.1 ABC transporter permease [Phaeobacter gallaeciensis]MDE4204149.1 ABC transporter permease [Phaeobacter gallaeciensis]MDE4208291.1 ABC transporter permease [Phaeobacter gallaeciensis]MDE4216460.1 ABC transporter permease [Phaeobacter gallaeciensis]
MPWRNSETRELRRQPLFTALSWLVLLLLYAPIAVLILFSFNDNRSVVVWTEASLKWYAKALENDDIRNAAWISIRVALTATTIATVVATMAALATTRGGSYRGRAAAIALINQPLMIPEIVTAIATLSFFSILRQLTGITGLGWLILAHTVFCIPFAFIPVRARLADMSETFETAAADLYATPWKTFRHVTMPLLMPGILAGAMLAFVVSLDDVIITLLIAGPGETTLPIYILGQIRRGVTPEVNAVSTILILLTVAMVALTFALQRKRK